MAEDEGFEFNNILYVGFQTRQKQAFLFKNIPMLNKYGKRKPPAKGKK